MKINHLPDSLSMETVSSKQPQINGHGEPASAQHMPVSHTVEGHSLATPCYVSYPTQDHFIEAVNEHAFANALKLRDQLPFTPLSLYIHLPFCHQLCSYCTSHKVVTSDYKQVTRYIDLLCKEISLVTSHTKNKSTAASMYWGGGSPSYLSCEDIDRLATQLGEHFDISAETSCELELDPRHSSQEKIACLFNAGFRHLRLCIEDLDTRVQHSINRVHPMSLVENNMVWIRDHNFKSVGIDLRYGLPKQTITTFSSTIDHVIRLQADRVALHPYAHSPAHFDAQRWIDSSALPNKTESDHIRLLAHKKLLAAGYVHLGLDNFARSGDERVTAQRSGSLRRNLQGYCTHASTDTLALGISGISQVGECYFQNTRSLKEYSRRIQYSVLPTARGIQLNRDDMIRKTVIMSLLCNGSLAINSINNACLIDFHTYFKKELKQLNKLQNQGWINYTGEDIVVTPIGRSSYLSKIASIFDKHRQNQLEQLSPKKLL